MMSGTAEGSTLVEVNNPVEQTASLCHRLELERLARMESEIASVEPVGYLLASYITPPYPV